MHGRTKSFAAWLLATLLSTPALAAAPTVEDSWGRHGDLTIKFDQPMLTWEGRTAAAQLSVTPTAPCIWYWQNDTTLGCETGRGGFKGGLREATVYHVAVAGLWSQAGEQLAPVELAIAHEPPTLDVSFIDWNHGWPTIDVVSQHAVTADAIARAVDLIFKGERLPYRLELRPRSREDDAVSPHTVFYRLTPESSPPGPGLLRLVLRAGLQSPLGDALGESDELRKATVGAPFGFDGRRCYDRANAWRAGEEGECSPEMPVLLAFTRPLSPKSIEALRAVLPAGVTLTDAQPRCRTDCENSRVGPVHHVELKSDLAGRSWSMRLPDGLQSVEGETLAGAIDVVVPMKSWEAGYRIEPRVTLGLPGATAPPAVEARNLPRGDRWVELSVGADVALRERRVGRPGGDEDFVPVAIAEVAKPVLRDGGVSIGGSRGYAPGTRATAVAPFNVLVGRAAGQTLAWATEWADSRAVHGAAVDVLDIGLDGGSKVLASGRTGVDGVAVLDVHVTTANLYSDPSGLRVLRVVSGERVVVVPVLAAAAMSLSDPIDDVRAEDDYGIDEPKFGVTGRLLYRPGETVEYRFWPRRRDGNRFALPEVTTAVPMQLKGNDVVHRKWTTDLDEWGSTHGTIALPERLPDGYYCISDDDGHGGWYEYGACFEVARFGGQAMWAEASASTPVLLGGERLEIAVRGGYFSGGPAAEAKLRLMSLVRPAGFGEAYPAFANHAFLDDPDRSMENDPLEGQPVPATLDRDGEATISATMPARFFNEDPPDEGGTDGSMAFALMQFNAAVRGDGDAEASSPTVRVYFAEFPRYVGLKTDRWWLPLDADPVLDAVVATHRGEALAGTPVQVRIETVGDAPEVLARCELAAGAPAPCAFRAPRAGPYAVVAESPGAAPVRIRRWFGASAPADAEDAPKVQLALLRASDGAAPARVRLTQPFPQATALFVVEYGSVRSHWTQAIGTDVEIDVPLQTDWAPGVTLRVFVRPAPGDAASGLAAKTLERSIVLAIPRVTRGAVSFTVADDTLAPGEGATLRLHNGSDGARLVTIAIVDDSVHQQVGWLHDQMDPAGAQFLGLLDTWGGSSWLSLHDWKIVPAFFHRRIAVDRSRLKRAQVEGAVPAVRLGRASEFESTELDSIEVTGSRLKMSDVFVEEPARERFEAAPGQRAGIAMARVRSRFPDAAYWNAGIVLAPGEHRELVVPLPDNLTRWRVLVWSSDAGDDFALSQGTLTTSLPVELRLGLPDHLYDGDTGSGTVNARAASGAATLDVQATADGAGVATSVAGRGAVAAYATLSRGLALSPDRDGDIGVLARAASAVGADAVSGRIPVHTRQARRTLPQAGWLEGTLRLPLPALAGDVRDPRLALTVSRGTAAWRAGWIDELRDYPHRCWEQTLSRGLGAALALADAEGREAWPEAQSVLDATFAEAPSFRDDMGNYHFFPPKLIGFGPPTSGPLNAWTLRAYGLLEELGQPVPALLVEHFDVEEQLPGPKDELTRERAVAAAQIAAARAGSDDPVDDALLRRLWAAWDLLDWHARSELVRALAVSPELAGEAGEGLVRLRESGERRGLRRVVADPRDFGWAMGSSLRDQCSVTAALWDLDPSPEHLADRRAYLRGVQDLYAGGTPSLDTQASVHCLLALRAAAKAGEGATDSELVATLGAATTRLRVDAAAPVAHWETPVEKAVTLELAMPSAADATLAYVAELTFVQDLRDAESTAVGMQLQRRYAVLRDGAWTAVEGTAVREGDWVRITLQLSAPTWRHFVALTDLVPGGWTTRDLRLEGVGGAAMRAIGDPGSWWFDERQTGAGDVRLYAKSLPPGVHEVHYFAQALHAGEYLAPPATAELMYGRASRATTAPDTVRIAPAR